MSTPNDLIRRGDAIQSIKDRGGHPTWEKQEIARINAIISALAKEAKP